MCLYPVTMRSVDAFGCNVMQSFPCGKCIECLKDKQNSWKIRIVEECRDHLYVYFFTLTYSDEHISKVLLTRDIPDPKVDSYLNHDGYVYNVEKRHLQIWLKRNRIYFERYFKREIDFKYFICAEYGPTYGRPHYHGVLFTDISPVFISRMFNDWSFSYGFTKYSLVSKSNSKSSASKVGNYVAKYCAKHSKFKSDVEIEVDKLVSESILDPTFYIMSKGIGLSYVNRLKRYHVPNNIRSPSERVSIVCDRAFYHDGAFKYKLPRYYRDRLYRKKFPCDAKVWNPKLKQYENKIVYRYKSKNLLSLQMQAEVRSRILAEYHRRFAEMRSLFPYLSDIEIDIKLLRSEEYSKKARQIDLYTKQSRFYNYQRFAHRAF